jgi:hypothetical protein
VVPALSGPVPHPPCLLSSPCQLRWRSLSPVSPRRHRRWAVHSHSRQSPTQHLRTHQLKPSLPQPLYLEPYNPKPFIFYPASCILNLKLQTLEPKPLTLSPKP